MNRPPIVVTTTLPQCSLAKPLETYVQILSLKSGVAGRKEGLREERLPEKMEASLGESCSKNNSCHLLHMPHWEETPCWKSGDLGEVSDLNLSSYKSPVVITHHH